nr:glycosyltransferase family 2 protein [uncultured Flavobacterium sp.]
MKTIALVILNWNGKSLLEKFLPTIINYSPQAQIYVADNASTDDSVAFIKQNYSSVTIIQNSDNFGYAQGYNEALTQVKEPILGLINSDIEVTPNWLTPIQNVFDTKADVAIVQPQILAYSDKNKYEYAGAGGGFIDKFGFPFCRGRLFDTLENKDIYASDYIFWASGACFFIKNEVFTSLGGFDSDFFAHQEEIDLCWRAFNKNHKAFYCAESTVYHVGGATLEQGNPHKTFLNFRNSLCMMAKNLPKSKLFPIIFIRLCLDGIAGIRFLLQGKFKHLWAVFISHFAFYARLNKMLKKRDGFSKSNYYYTNSVVYQYFVKGNKYFRDI